MRLLMDAVSPVKMVAHTREELFRRAKVFLHLILAKVVNVAEVTSDVQEGSAGGLNVLIRLRTNVAKNVIIVLLMAEYSEMDKL